MILARNEKEHLMKIDQNILYAPCPCQSGKKFKFCCWPKYRDRIDDGMSMSEITVMIRGDELDMSGVLANDEANGLFDMGYDLMKKGDIEQAVVFSFIKMDLPIDFSDLKL